MKTLLKSLLFIALTVIGFSCDQEKTAPAQPGHISFSVDSKAGGRTSGIPASLLISIKDSQGKSVYENKKLPLISFGQGFLTEEIEIETGNYTITKFLVLDNKDKITYATPLEGSEKAALVNDALPISFTVTSLTTSNLKPQVLAVSSQDTPQSFGYVSFGFEVVLESETMDIQVKLELLIGGLFYQDVDTEFIVTAYDSLNNKKWANTFPYSGPDPNILTLKNNYHHYVFEVKKWGVYDKQVIKGKYLWESRVRPGEVPATYVFGGSAAPKKLASTINYFENADPDHPGSKIMQPQTKTEYTYNVNGTLDKISSSNYDASTKQFIPNMQQKFTYLNTRLQKITTYLQGNTNPYSEDFYTYDVDGKVSKIIDKNYGNVTTEVNLTYSFTDRVINASYTFSNGGSFQYEFVYGLRNIKTDKTTKAGQLCNEGTYTYDKNINPLKHLGYVDYLFRNYSINNRLTENVNYTGCSFPTLVPESYQYSYDADGYPLIATTTYKSKTAKSQLQYFYQ